MDLESIGRRKWQTGDEVNVIGDVVATYRNATGCGDGTIEVKCVIRGASSNVNDQRAALALLAVQRHLSRRDRRENNIVDLQRHFTDQLDAVLNAGADAVDHVKVCFHGFAEKADRADRMLQPIEPVIANDRMKINVILWDVNFAGDGARLFDVLGGYGRLAIGQAIGSAVVDSLNVGSGHGQIDAADFDIAGIFRLSQRVL